MSLRRRPIFVNRYFVVVCRALSQVEAHDPNAYPLNIFVSLKSEIQCRACQTRSAKYEPLVFTCACYVRFQSYTGEIQLCARRWMTVDSDNCPDDPCYYCGECYNMFHFDRNNQKLFKFDAYLIQISPSSNTVSADVR